MTALDAPDLAPLRGRERELAELGALMERARTGRSGSVVVTGEAGIGKTALLDHLAARAAPHTPVKRISASESEIELAYAGLQLLCGPLMDASTSLPTPQRVALELALGLREGAAPSLFLVGLAVLGLLTEVAARRSLLCIVDDAQWLDEASAGALAFVTRRLDTEGVAVVLAMRTAGAPFTGLPVMAVGGLGDDDARALFLRALPGPLDPRVADQVIAEARGNPLALQELPRAVSPADVAGGFALAGSIPLEGRIERGLLARLEPLPSTTRLLLLLAAADPTGDTALLRRAGEVLHLGPHDFDLAEAADVLVVGARVDLRHPLLRSAVYRGSSPDERRQVHAALADATDVDRDPDRRAWHAAAATVLPDERVAAALERSATRARTRGGAAATAAFLERAAQLTPDPVMRADRLLAAAEAKHDAGAPAAVVRLLDSARDQPLTELQAARAGRLRARAEYAQHRDRSGARQLLAAARALEGLDKTLARDTYIEALAAAVYRGQLGNPDELVSVSRAIVAATDADVSGRARDLLLRGQALLFAEGQTAALPTLRQALRAFVDDPLDALELHWLWFACRAAIDVWDSASLRALADRQVELARAAGVLTVLPIALNQVISMRIFDGRLDAAAAACDEMDAVQAATGHPLPPYGRLFVAAYRGEVEEVERRARQLRAEGTTRGEGFALSAANSAQALVYNGAGRYADAMAVARRELPHTRELGYSARALVELVEAASRAGQPALAEQAFEHLAAVTRPVGTDWALALAALAEAQLRTGDEAETLYQEGIERFERVEVPMLEARGRLLYGEMLRRNRRTRDAREQLRAAHEVLSGCGYHGFADRAARELRATGETLRPSASPSTAVLTAQETNVARLARDGLTNRDIGARLFISARTAEYHLHKVFVKLGVSSRAELTAAMWDIEPAGS